MRSAPSTGLVPYFIISIGGTDYASRLEYIEHHEEPYRDRAIIGLNNRDNALDSLDLTGQSFEIQYGWDSVAAPTATLWVKSYQIISVEGERIYQIYAEGIWMALREMKVMAGINDAEADIYSTTFNATYTVRELINLVLTSVGFTLSGSPDDGIITTFKPIFIINQLPFESAASVLYRLIWMVKCYLRPKPSSTLELVYPQAADVEDEIYYSNQSPYFDEYDGKVSLLIPNSIVVLCQDINGNILVGTGSDTTEIAKYHEVIEPYIDNSITTQTDADNRAAVILSKIKAEIPGGRVIPLKHDCRVELYDKVQVSDVRT